MAKNGEVVQAFLRKQGPLDLVCVDVFDTIVTRRVGDPEAVFFVVGQKLHRQGDITLHPETFARARALAERLARRHLGESGEITLDDIYRQLVRAHGQLKPVLNRLMAEELATEAELLCVLPGAHDLLNAARAAAKRLAFVSDMYLPSLFLRQQLQKRHLLQKSDLVFVSCECGSAKVQDGALFRYVLQKTGVSSACAIHVGNSWEADVVAARTVGLKPLHIKTANLNRFERAMEDQRWQTGGAGSFFAGASRFVRCQLQQADPRVEALTTVAASVAAPLITAFVYWVLTQAKRQGIDRLYFLAREGQVMYRVARIFKAKWQLPIQLHYMFCSRKSLNHALLCPPSLEDMRWALTHVQGQSLRRVLSRLSLYPEELSELLSKSGLTSSRWDEPFDPRDQEILIEILLRSDVAPLIEAKAKSARVLIEAYLAQLKFFEDPLCGIVDSGGLGSQIRTLDKIKRTRGGLGVKGFLIFRNGDPPLAAGDFPAVDTYCHDGTHDGNKPFFDLWQLVEVFCASNHGAVVGYERHHERVRPVLLMDRSARIRDWGIDQVQLSICAFAEALLSAPISPEVFEQANLSQLVEVLMAMLWNAPATDEAAVWGEFPWEQDAVSSEIPLGQPLAWRDLLAILKREPRQKPPWLAASEQRSPAHIRTILRLGRKAFKRK
jgi:FMN phosphatase YigB (HAD superfamily)